MKKLLSLTLALLMVFSLATVAMAAESSTVENGGEFTFKMSYKLVGAGTSPAETFSFGTVTLTAFLDGEEASKTSEVPTIAVESYDEGAATADGAAATVTVTLPEYSAPGIYVYAITQVDQKTAGVTYDITTYYLVVTVVNASDGGYQCIVGLCSDYAYENGKVTGTKIDNIENTYTANTLSIKKVVTGNLADTEKEFTFTVTFESESEIYTWSALVSPNVAGVTDSTYKPTDAGKVVFELAHDETATFENIPSGVTYTVTETDYTDDGYTTTYDDYYTGTMAGEAISTVVTNEKKAEVDTGITLDSVPFILILSVCAAAVVLFVIKRRNTVEF